MLFNLCCLKFKLLLRSFTIVTISRFKLLYFEPYLCFIMISYSDLYSSAIGTTSWAGRTVFIPEPKFLLWAVSVADP